MEAEEEVAGEAGGEEEQENDSIKPRLRCHENRDLDDHRTQIELIPTTIEPDTSIYTVH